VLVHRYRLHGWIKLIGLAVSSTDPVTSLTASGPVLPVKMTLTDVADPVVWRRILILAAISLDTLHDVIQRDLGWQDCRLHVFRIGEVAYGTDPEDTLGYRDGTKVRLASVADVDGRSATNMTSAMAGNTNCSSKRPPRPRLAGPTRSASKARAPVRLRTAVVTRATSSSRRSSPTRPTKSTAS